MEIIKTKSVKVQDYKIGNKKDTKRLHTILKEHAGGFWYLLHTDVEGEVECILTPMAEDIEAAGYIWKQYQIFEREFYGKRLWGSAPVGFEYKG